MRPQWSEQRCDALAYQLRGDREAHVSGLSKQAAYRANAMREHELARSTEIAAIRSMHERAAAKSIQLAVRLEQVGH